MAGAGLVERVLGWGAVVPLLLGGAAAPAAGDGEVVFRLQDPAIVEASGLAVVDGLFVTHNDSGDGARVFTVDPGTGRTVGTTSWAGEPDDLEAVAPAGLGEVWVGDIGDNPGSRDAIAVHRVPVGPGQHDVAPPTYWLTYPDGPRDAETLLAHPVTGRLYVVSKVVFGGTLYAAPAELAGDRPNPMRAVGRVLGFATDGAFFPDGRHLVLRDYGSATVYSWPDLEEVGSFALPEQQQGEAIAVDARGRVYAGTEGLHAPVHRVRLPDDVAAAVAPPETTGPPSEPPLGEPSGEPSPGESPGSVPGAEAPLDDEQSDESGASGASVEDATARPAVRWPWVVAGGLGVLALGAAVAGLLRRRRA